jgi:hypothetical protein
MSVSARVDAPGNAARQNSESADAQKLRCLCGKWWSYRSGDTVILRCKLCRREIVIGGENITITYR